MDIENQTKIQELWANEKCPIVNGIIFGNGLIKKLELIRDELYKPVEIRLNNEITILNFLQNKPSNLTGLTSITQLCEKFISEKNIRLVAGEAGWGGDGFVAVENLDSNQLQFLLFFDNSNPFVEIDFLDSNILALSNLGERWIIPIEEPEKMTVISLS